MTRILDENEGKEKKARREMRSSWFTDSRELDETMGSTTGEADRAVEAGGWTGTDDATSTAPSDQIGNPPMAEEEKPLHTITHDFDESIQRDEERQEEDAEEAEETSELLTLAEERVKKERHRLAEGVRAVKKREWK
jgi:hypothetical protein